MSYSDFWYMSNMDGIGTSHGAKRWWIDVPLHVDTSWRLRKGELTVSELMPLLVKSAHFVREDDLPMCTELLIVSERAKEVLEASCPGNCAFVPINIQGVPKPLESKYFAVDRVARIDCMDRSKSLGSGPPGRCSYYHVVVDPEKVPPMQNIFYIADGPFTCVVRDFVREAIVKERLRGPLFYTPWQPSHPR